MKIHRIKHFSQFLRNSLRDLIWYDSGNIRDRIDLVKENWGDMRTQNLFQEDEEMLKITERLQNITRPIVNNELKAHLKKIVIELIKKSARKEALEILTKTSQERIGEFLYYYYSDSANVACMVLDSAKDELVKLKKMKKGGKDSFGGITH